MPVDLTLAMALGLLLHAAEHLLAAAYEWVQRQVHAYGRHHHTASAAQVQAHHQQDKASRNE